MPKGIVLNTLETLIEALKGTQYPTIIFLAEGNALTIQEIINAIKGENLENLPKQVAISSKQLEVAVQDKDNVLPVSDFFLPSRTTRFSIPIGPRCNRLPANNPRK